MIAIIARVPLPGRAKTRLVPALGPERAAALAAAMAADVVALVQALGVPARVAVEGPLDHPWTRALPLPVEPQVAGDLGARMAHALRDGGVAVGTDAPTLPAALLHEALAALAARAAGAPDAPDVTLAPAADGGYVLVGATADAVARGLFVGVPWSTDRTLAAQRDRAAALRLSTRLLPAWYDVDEPADLAALRGHLASLPSSVAPHTRAFLQDPDAAPLR